MRNTIKYVQSEAERLQELKDENIASRQTNFEKAIFLVSKALESFPDDFRGQNENSETFTNILQVEKALGVVEDVDDIVDLEYPNSYLR